MSIHEQFEAVIGLEVHAQLSTRSKIFCGCSTAFGSAPNSNVCPVCLGMPGVLPVLNKQVVEYAIRLGLATGCSINPRSIFARKNYFYPDLPKGYQISQYEEPICRHGHVDITNDDGTVKRIGITRIHMEEDAGKSIHDQDHDTLVDVNRCGTPLLEIVSEPDMRSAQEAVRYLTSVWQTVKYLDICDGNMEEGSFRCDANVSVRKKGETKLGTKTELKNMNSFRNVERAIEYETQRQIELIAEGGAVVQETLLWNAEKNTASSMRSKEEAHDYRYFPDPDLVPVVVDEHWIAAVRMELPELPAVRRARFVGEYKLPPYDAEVLTQERPLADYFEGAVRVLANRNDEQVKTVSNWVMTEVMRVMNERGTTITEFPVSPDHLGALVELIGNGTISGKIAKEVFAEMVATGEHPKAVVERKGLVQISDSGAIEKEIDVILAKFPNEIARFRAGEAKLMGFFVGETMKVMKGRGNPKLINEILGRKLSELNH
ncbi:MAG: Asp-tRNA(Asn)/Glu-tRNA(Gln) amidotransferase subunit GatB [Bacteroidetes bacterium]|nr:Asp-tRNA(Asn)/Glu-tRNA(Gln) amidotransferase subunit GatB [Bacteroidota bacterium]